MTTKLIRWLCVFLVLILGVVPVLAETDCPPACDWGDKQEWDDDDTESFYDGRCTIVLVQIKAGRRVLLFDSDGCVDGYCVSGIGTSSGRAWENSPRHDISNVSWCINCPPTAVTLAYVNGDFLSLAFPVIVAVLAIAILVLLYGIREYLRRRTLRDIKALDETLKTLARQNREAAGIHGPSDDHD